MTKQLENRITSREVAEMLDVEHSKLLRKIEDINEDFRKAKIGFSKYWIEGTYLVDGNNKPYKEFQVSKQGCEFLAHKTTGTKGNLFTDKYMDRFEKMKSIIENNVSKQIKDNPAKTKEIEARYNNSLSRKANTLLKIAANQNLSKEYVQVLQAKAIEILTGQNLLPLPVAEQQTYSAEEIGKQLGITANMVGRISKANNLKTEQYGKLYHDKSRYSNKEVESFRYYGNVIPAIKTILAKIQLTITELQN